MIFNINDNINDKNSIFNILKLFFDIALNIDFSIDIEIENVRNTRHRNNRRTIQ